MTSTAPCEEVTGLRGLAGIDTFRSTDFLDQVAQRHLHEALVERAAAHALGKCHFTDFAQQAGGEAKRRADDPFGK
jgi:hypothetical protein